ncbi:uncharacterized protein LOC118418855 isoform X1 [Branchiostoma floridae]|uniref:Uncharacterized protein LOC118418855 isoform X1 n=1 Tax=Branchiostoma floridae TaxID=7739 RepID=A0A9J7MUX2_BRAFL|nr:uncharacterized protein LOC118418855 isoform X1 [Branchiostoma floridae]
MCFIVRYSLHIYIVVVGLVAFSGIVDRYVDRHLAAHRTLARLPAVVENGFRHYQLTDDETLILATVKEEGRAGRPELVWCGLYTGPNLPQKLAKIETEVGNKNSVLSRASHKWHFTRVLTACQSVRGPNLVYDPITDDDVYLPGMPPVPQTWCQLGSNMAGSFVGSVASVFCPAEDYRAMATRAYQEAVSRDRAVTLLRKGTYPGTWYCGTGDRSTRLVEYQYEFLLGSLDSCCLEHTRCEETIEPGQTKFSLYNPGSHPLLPCWCEAYFEKCLQKAGTSPAHDVGDLYFNYLDNTCYELQHRTVCTGGLLGVCWRWEATLVGVTRDLWTFNP